MSEEEAIEYKRMTTPFHSTKRKGLSRMKRAKLFALHDGVCVLCKSKIDGVRERWIDEHIIPLSRGGSNEMDNRGPAHEKCAIEKTKFDKAGLAKDRRIYAKNIGAVRSKQPMAGSRASGWKRKMNGTWERRDR